MPTQPYTNTRMHTRTQAFLRCVSVESCRTLLHCMCVATHSDKGMTYATTGGNFSVPWRSLTPPLGAMFLQNHMRNGGCDVERFSYRQLAVSFHEATYSISGGSFSIPGVGPWACSGNQGKLRQLAQVYTTAAATATTRRSIT